MNSWMRLFKFVILLPNPYSFHYSVSDARMAHRIKAKQVQQLWIQNHLANIPWSRRRKKKTGEKVQNKMHPSDNIGPLEGHVKNLTLNIASNMFYYWLDYMLCVYIKHNRPVLESIFSSILAKICLIRYSKLLKIVHFSRDFRFSNCIPAKKSSNMPSILLCQPRFRLNNAKPTAQKAISWW